MLTTLSDVERSAWDALLDDEATPFMRWDFLEALESGGCAVPQRGWLPQHVTLWRDDRLVAAAPAYVKLDSAGDFSRDWGWVGMIERAGASYYPKLVLCVPFTPVPSSRVLVAEGEEPAELIEVVANVAMQVALDHELGGVHALFHREDEAAGFRAAGWHHRTLFQFHWHNPGWSDSDAWLGSFKSKRRHQLKRERSMPGKQGIELRTLREADFADDPGGWARKTYDLYSTTCQKFMWGGTYLTPDFYRRIFERMAANLELVSAWRGDELIAGAFNVGTDKALYGRYWGCHEEHQFLHFNVCLYHSIDECIEMGRLVFEGGMGGEHKVSRGFSPVFVHSHHWFAHPQVHTGMGRVLASERDAMQMNLRRHRQG